VDELERRLVAVEKRQRSVSSLKTGVFEMRDGETFESAESRADAEGYGACLIVPKIPETEAEIERWCRRTIEYQELLVATARRVCLDPEVDVLAVAAWLRAEYERILST